MINKPQLLLLQSIIFIAFVAMTLPYPIIPPVILSISSIKTTKFFLYDITPETQVSLTLGAYPLGLFIGSFLFGQFSDRYGKKITLLVSLLLASIVQMSSGYLIAHKFYDGLLITRFLTGLFEGNIAIARSAIAILCLTEDLKRKHFARSNAALTLGWAIGPLLGSFFSDNKIVPSFGYSTPFYIGSSFTIFCFLLTLLKFNEPTIKKTLHIVSHPNTEYLASSFFENKLLLLLIFSSFLTLGIDAFYQFLPLYLSIRFSPTPLIIGVSVSIVALASTAVNIILAPIMGKFIDAANSLVIFPLSLSICLLIIGISKFQLVIFILLPFIGSFIALTMTNITVLISIKSSQLIQGKLMGLLLSQRTLGTALISFSMIPLLKYSSRAPFIVGALLLLFSALLMAYISNKYNFSNLLTSKVLFKRQNLE
jgi:MFS family permease